MSDFKKDPLELLRKKNPSDLQMHRWQTAVKMQLPAPYSGFSLRHILQLVVATGVGIVIGAVLFGAKTNDTIDLEKSYQDATVEVIYTKLD